MANVIQIKRSATTATPPTLAVGELAFSENSGNLFIGKTGSVVQKIAGEAEITKLAGIEAGAQVNTVTSVNTYTGAVTLVKGDVGLGNVDNTSDLNKPVSTATQTALDLKAPIASPTFTGTVSGVTKAMVGLGNADNTSDANKPVSSATQTALDLKLNLAGGTLTGALTLAADPTLALHAATKQYVDATAIGLDWKNSVKAASTANVVSLSGAQTVDGVSLVATDRVVLKNQTTGSENGIWVVQTGAWTRPTDWVTGNVSSGAVMYVEAGGTANAGTSWICTTTGAITVDTTAITFAQFAAGTVYTASTGLQLIGSAFSIDSTVLTTASTLDVTKFSSGTAAAFNGSNITNLNATNIATGTIADARLSAAVLLNTSIIDGGSF